MIMIEAAGAVYRYLPDTDDIEQAPDCTPEKLETELAAGAPLSVIRVSDEALPSAAGNVPVDLVVLQYVEECSCGEAFHVTHRPGQNPPSNRVSVEMDDVSRKRALLTARRWAGERAVPHVVLVATDGDRPAEVKLFEARSI